MLNKTTQELAALLGLNIEVDLVAFQYNVPDQLLDNGGVPQFLTIHDTANTSAGADAHMHRNFVANGGGAEFASFTYAVDDKRAVQILLEDHVNYAQGGTPNTGNHVSLSIETCIASDENWLLTLENLAMLAACLTVRFEKQPSWIVQHNYWWGKDCPGKIRHQAGAWQGLLDKIQTYVDQLHAKLTPPPPQPDPNAPVTVNGHAIHTGFLDLWKKYGLEVMGLPLSDEYTQVEPALGGRSVQYQDFENVIVQWYQGIQPRICAGIRKYKYGK